MTIDFADCVLLNTVMAARAMTRRYDDKLRNYGITVVQFSVMGAVRNSGDLPVARMAQRIAMDRTTMIRNLELLERKGLVTSKPALKGSGRSFALTGRGDALLNDIIPAWQQAQREVRALLGESDSDELLKNLRRLRDG